MRRRRRRIRLSDGTRVPVQEENTSWTDGKNVVIFPDVGEAVFEVGKTGDPKVTRMLDDQGNEVTP